MGIDLTPQTLDEINRRRRRQGLSDLIPSRAHALYVARRTKVRRSEETEEGFLTYMASVPDEQVPPAQYHGAPHSVLTPDMLATINRERRAKGLRELNEEAARRAYAQRRETIQRSQDSDDSFWLFMTTYAVLSNVSSPSYASDAPSFSGHGGSSGGGGASGSWDSDSSSSDSSSSSSDSGGGGGGSTE